MWGVLESVLSLGIQNVADVVMQGRLRWYGQLELKSEDDWMPACREVVE